MDVIDDVVSNVTDDVADLIVDVYFVPVVAASANVATSGTVKLTFSAHQHNEVATDKSVNCYTRKCLRCIS